MKIVVVHGQYGCETGCCGHWIKIDGDVARDTETGHMGFAFDHPNPGETPRAFAERVLREELGEAHVADLDFENCVILLE